MAHAQARADGGLVLVVRPEAAGEIRAAAFAYADIDRQLCRAFIDDVDDAIQRGLAGEGEATLTPGLPSALRPVPLQRFGYRLYFFAHAMRLYLVACLRSPRAMLETATRLAS